ncbi:MAG: cytochrome b/b6 domain-containing protein [Pseudobdellovibrionaceae bacterium]
MSSIDIVWDKKTRFLHWLIAGIIVTNLYILEEGDPPHRYAGYVAVGLVFLRTLIGFFSKSESSFKKFPLSLSQLKQYLLGKINKSSAIEYPGHNPAGAWTYIGMWTLVLCLGVSGFMMGLDAFWGEDWLEEAHNVFGILLQLLIAAHLVGMALDSYQFKRKAWMGMFHGRK